ncbi:hypothetical protein AMS68_005434 [Peltaster fructicola]|uniref:Uncharacterized protein n=1 Tax=Peltaster fructicola TaxID=286661 RepID=A0A6H0XYU6_9PEZI|nr:hypothetical protein AMS68_005434 [Peltaster fructicola]
MLDLQKRWNGTVLTVLWVIQFVVIPLHIGATAGILMQYAYDLHYIPAIWVAQLTFFAIAFLTLPIEITGYLYEFLNPWVFLGLQVFKTLFYTLGFAFLLYNFVHAPQISSGIWNILKYAGLSLNILILVTFLVALVYGSTVLHKYRKIGAQYKWVNEDQDENTSSRRKHQRITH